MEKLENKTNTQNRFSKTINQIKNKLNLTLKGALIIGGCLTVSGSKKAEEIKQNTIAKVNWIDSYSQFKNSLEFEELFPKEEIPKKQVSQLEKMYSDSIGHNFTELRTNIEKRSNDFGIDELISINLFRKENKFADTTLFSNYQKKDKNGNYKFKENGEKDIVYLSTAFGLGQTIMGIEFRKYYLEYQGLLKKVNTVQDSKKIRLYQSKIKYLEKILSLNKTFIKSEIKRLNKNKSTKKEAIRLSKLINPKYSTFVDINDRIYIGQGYGKKYLNNEVKTLNPLTADGQIIASLTYVKYLMKIKKCNGYKALAYYNAGPGIDARDEKIIKNSFRLNQSIKRYLPKGYTKTAKNYVICAIAYYSGFEEDLDYKYKLELSNYLEQKQLEKLDDNLIVYDEFGLQYKVGDLKVKIKENIKNAFIKAMQYY